MVRSDDRFNYWRELSDSQHEICAEVTSSLRDICEKQQNQA